MPMLLMRKCALCSLLINSPFKVVCGAWYAEAMRELPRENKMYLKSMQVNVSKMRQGW